MKFRSAIFDMDGTIIDSMGIWKELASRTFLDHGIEVPQDLESRIFTMTFLESAEYCLQLSGSGKTAEELVEEWNQGASVYYKSDISLKPYAEEFIIYLKQMGMKLSLTTSNFMEIALDVLGRLNVLQYFDSITATQEVSRSKLYPDVFLLSAARLETDPPDCIVFEDSHSSILGAKAAGMFVVGVYDEYARFHETSIRQNSDRYILSFEELLGNDEFFKGGDRT
ncbi:MAG: HAD family hydrolase [Saccharofermentanales bacterium]